MCGVVAGAVMDRRASFLSRGAGGIVSAEIDVNLLDQFGIELLAGIDRIAAGIVQRNAVEGLRNSSVGEAANIHGAASRAEGIVVLETDARQQVDEIGRASCRERVCQYV